MYCPKCGNPDQKENSYCRKCGEFLPDLHKVSKPSFGGNTPQQNVKAISTLSLLASVSSLVIAISMYATNMSVPVILYLAAAILLCNSAWHLSNFYIVRKLANRLNPKQEHLANQSQASLENKSDVSQNILPPADINEFISPNSITEDTTRRLSKKVIE